MNELKKPAWTFHLLRWFCPPQLLEEIEGDLLERFSRDLRDFGEVRSKRRLILNTLRFFRGDIILRNTFSFTLFRMYLLANNITIAFRAFKKQKVFTALNVIGLSIGMAASMLILHYVKYEKSFDNYHSRANDIYRIQYNVWHNGRLNLQSSMAVPAIGPALKNNFGEVEEFTRLYPVGGVMTYQSSAGPVSFHEEKMPFADPALFKVFDIEVLKGDISTSLSLPNKVMLSERAVRKYFKDEDPMGKIITQNGNESFEVTGVFKNIPENSHLKFDFLLSYETLKNTYDSYQTSWGWYDFYTYVLLKPNTNLDELQAKLDAFLKKEKGDKWKTSSQEFILRPLHNIHLHSNLLYEANPDEQRDGDSIDALRFIAFFVIAIAMINYVNLATARSLSRAKEVGVRKVIGASKLQLVGQFLVESILLYAIAFSLAFITICFLWVPFSSLTGWNIPLSYIYQGDFWVVFLLIFTAGVVFSGLYPAVIAASFKPVVVLKGKLNHAWLGQMLRKGLVTFQFVASVFLIICSTIVYQQVHFMKSSDLGVTIDRTLVLRGPGAIDSIYNRNLNSFKNEVLRIPGVKSMTATTNIPGDEIYWTGGIRRFSGGPKDHVMVSHVAIDPDFVSSFGLNLIAGNDFNKEASNDNRHVLVNRSLTEVLQFKDPQSAIGAMLWQQGDTIEIVGVLEDYHQMSLKTEVVPMVLMLRQSAVYFALTIESDNYDDILNRIEAPWKASFASAPIDYFFLDDFYNKQYEKDDRFGNVLSYFTGLAILIAILGLIGLASYSTTQRTKEIGIRKVLGSTVLGIVFLLAAGFMGQIVLANLIGWPLAWWVMDNWLQSFPYRISIDPLIFVLSGGAIALIAFIAVSSQTFGAAIKHPVKTLRYE